MRVARVLPILSILFGLGDPIYAQQPDKSPDRMFALGTPQFIREKKSDDTFTIVVPIKAQKPGQFEKPGLKIAYVVFDKTLKAPPDDLKSDEGSFILNTDKSGAKDLTWQVRSVQQGVTGQAHAFLGAPQYKAAGNDGIMRFGLRGLPDKDIGVFVIDKMQPGSNVLIFRKNDFVAGDGDATFQAAVAKSPAGGR
jgi:hypothetical protein